MRRNAQRKRLQRDEEALEEQYLEEKQRKERADRCLRQKVSKRRRVTEQRFQKKVADTKKKIQQDIRDLGVRRAANPPNAGGWTRKLTKRHRDTQVDINRDKFKCSNPEHSWHYVYQGRGESGDHHECWTGNEIPYK